MVNNIELLQFQLKQKLKLNSEKKRELATSGKIEPSRLAHYKTSNLLFSKALPNTGRKYKAVFLLDVSGSMYTGKLRTAVKSLINLIKLFHWVVDFSIITYWETTKQISVEEILSIPYSQIDSMGYEELYKFFNRNCWFIYVDGKRHFLIKEDWTESLWWATCWQPAFLEAANILEKQEGEKYIIFLTDWQDNFNWNCVIGWIDTSVHNEATYKQDAADVAAKGIKTIPFSIWRDYLSKTFDNAISLSSAEDVFELTLEALDGLIEEPFK